MIVYVLICNKSVNMTSLLVDTTFLKTSPVVYVITYPLVSDELVQLTLILVAFNMNPFTLFGGPLGARKNTCKGIID